MKNSVLAISLLFAGIAGAQDPSASTSREVAGLFSALQTSNCEFYRNGSWYNAENASEHLQHKYAYLLKKGKVTSTESFIELAASKSSVSGKSYQVRCGKAAPVSSQSWFTGKLKAIRGSGRR